MMRWVLLLAVTMLAAGCSGAGADDGERTVVAGFYPAEYAAERIAGNHAEIVGLSAPGVAPHDLELSLTQTADVSEADLVVYDRDLQPAVHDAVTQADPDHVVETSDIPSATPEDPHFWLDPAGMTRVARDVRDQMVAIDPAAADAYRANYERLRADLTALDREYERGLADCAVDTVVVSHDAFGQLERYGVRFEPISGLSPDVEPSPGRLAELQELIEARGVTTVFTEPLAGTELAQTLADDLSVETAVLDPIEGRSESDEDYLSLMRRNLAALMEANTCR